LSGEVVAFPHRSAGHRRLTKRQLAAELGRSTRWIEFQMLEGMPVLPRRTRSAHARFDLDAVRTWLAARADGTPLPLEERVARMERQVVTLEQILEAGRHS
jgi:phage terminase Nu1 subunit (DNA packaging protein)